MLWDILFISKKKKKKSESVQSNNKHPKKYVWKALEDRREKRKGKSKLKWELVNTEKK